MKKSIFGCVALFTGCVALFGAEELIKNGGFEAGTDGWVVKGKCAFDAADKTEGQQSLLVTKKQGIRFDEIRQEVKVEPETDYELSYQVKTDALEKANPQARANPQGQMNPQRQQNPQMRANPQGQPNPQARARFSRTPRK